MKAKRTAIEPNIFMYPDGHYEVRMTAGGRPVPPQRFPGDTALAVIRTWIAGTRERLEEAARDRGEVTVARRATGSLEAQAAGYFQQIQGRVGSAAECSHLRAWFPVVVDGVRLGDLSPHALTTHHVNAAIAQWKTKPSKHAIRTVRVSGFTRDAFAVEAYAIRGTTVQAHRQGPDRRIKGYERKGSTIAAHQHPGFTVEAYERSAPATSGDVVGTLTIRHRCRVLRDFYYTLNGRKAATPLDDAKVPPRPKRGMPVTVPAEVIMATLHKLRALDVKTHARFAVVATTAQRPVQVGTARPDDLQIANNGTAMWFVRNAKGGDPHPIVLTPAAVAAWEAFIAVDAWGAFDTGKYGKLIHEAGWPRGIRPYVARHSMSRAMIEQGISLGDIQAHLGHTDPNTTRTYAPFVVDRQRAVSTLMKDYLIDAFKPRLVKGGGGKSGK